MTRHVCRHRWCDRCLTIGSALLWGAVALALAALYVYVRPFS